MYNITLIQGDSTTTCKVVENKYKAKVWMQNEMQSMKKNVYPNVTTYTIAGEDTLLLLNRKSNNLLCAWIITKVECLGE
jgi:hypothetical protein